MNPNSPKRGEIWRVNFDPTIGTEIRKTRPAIVLSSDAVGRLPIKLVAPVTDWKDRYDFNFGMSALKPINKMVWLKPRLWILYSFAEWIRNDLSKNLAKCQVKLWKKLF